ncbi:MAG TPA: 23S rRNA (pseudouridine(1915)-N(3))-methyltransferase RlmH [Gemmatimonadales bacterium]|nr:23S rRNA (pseudouridine(1915)-N(3))-methyltransferase RlmH [Gemmatimonadales bacterium]
MKYRVVGVGRVRDAALRAACDEYRDRLSHYAKVEEVEVKDEARLPGAIPAETRLVALSRAGKSWSSRDLALQTERWEREARDVAFAIGGATALPAAVMDRADDVWSLSALTLPHELARLVVLEQLYRAFTIRRGEPYHRGP